MWYFPANNSSSIFMKAITSVHVGIFLWAALVVAISVYNVTNQPAVTVAAPLDTPVVVVEPIEVVAIEEHLNSSTSEAHTEKEVYECTKLPKIVGDKTVVLRIDDIQAFAWPSTTRMMIDDAASRNIPTVLGVIPNKLSLDVELVSFLRDRNCHYEIALHGFDHLSVGENQEIAEFEQLSYDQAYDRLARGLEELQVLVDKPIRTWIPPLNLHSTGTQAALGELGLDRWSTEGLQVWDYDASTYSYDTNALNQTDDVASDCEQSFEESDVCIIMLHPQDFTTNDFHDAEKYDEHYLALLDRLFEAGYSFGTFRDVDLSE